MRQKLKEIFNYSSLKKGLAHIVIKEVPCFLITFGAVYAGIGFLNHNPVLELLMALGISYGAQWGAERYFSHADVLNKPRKEILGLSKKGTFLALSFGLATWGIHVAVLHDKSPQNSGHQHGYHVEQHHHHEHENRPSRNFAPHLENHIRRADKQMEENPSLKL